MERALQNNQRMTPQDVGDDADSDVAHFRFEGRGRLILDTIHGEVVIDIRNSDVNSFVFDSRGRRLDITILQAGQ